MCGARRAARHGVGQRRYSDLAIETCLTLRTAYRLPLRQTQGLMGAIGMLMGLDIRVPDYSTLSRRANGLSIAQVMRQAGSVAVSLAADLRSRPHVFAIPALNKDMNTFAQRGGSSGGGQYRPQDLRRGRMARAEA